MNIQSNRFDRVLNHISKSYSKIDFMIEAVSQTKSRRLFLWALVILLCFSLLLVLNILTPLISDDFAYLFIYAEDARVTSLGDIVQSQINHYYKWGGRSIVHFIAQVLLMLPSFVADVLNTLAYLSFIFLIYFHIKGKKQGSISLFILINLAIWFVQPVFGDTILWLTGSANYLWGTTLVLLFLLPYRFYEGLEMNVIKQTIASIGIFLFGIIAGWTNENTAGAMILIAISFVVYYRSHTWNIPIWAVTGIIGAIIGYAIMILAPGNFERAGDATSLSLYTLAYRLFNCTHTFIYYSGSFLLISIVTAILYNRFPNGDSRDKLKLSFIYSLAAIAAVYAMMLSPTFPRRALFGVITYLMIATGIFFYNLDFQQKFLRQIRLGIISLGLLGFVFTYYLAIKEIKDFNNIMIEREAKIKEAKEQGRISCEFSQYDGGSYIHGEDPFSEVLMTRHYGIKIILK